MIVRMEADGVVVVDADDCSAVRVETALEPDALRDVLAATGTGRLAGAGRSGAEPVGDVAVLDIAVLRSCAGLVATAPGWARRFDAMIAAAGGRRTDDGLGLRVPVDRRSPGTRRS